MKDLSQKPTSPFSEGFRAGMKHVDELTETAPDFEAIAQFYKTCTRTTRRWHAAGVDLQSPIAVARHVLDQRNPSTDVLNRIEQIFD